jgi:hypothetical protein
MRDYPWYADNAITRKLGPYAAYVARRVNFEPLYPESEPILDWAKDDIKLLNQSIADDEDRWNWLSGEPLMRDLAHMLICDPMALTTLAKINAAYMDGFQHFSDLNQARIHMMSACLLLGHWDDHRIAKKWLREKTLELWTRAWIRRRTGESGIRRYHPTEEELDAAYQLIPPRRTPQALLKWPWERVYSSIGLAEVRRADRQRGQMSDAESRMETSGDKENRTNQESADAADHRNGTATPETVQLRLMPVSEDQHPKDPKAESQADSTRSRRDPL